MTDTNYPSATGTSQPLPPKKNNTKNLVIGLLAAGLLGTWGYLLYAKREASKQDSDRVAQISRVTDEKSEIQNNFNAALARLDSITGANNTLQGEKTALQKDIDSRKAEIRKLLSQNKLTQSDLAKANNMIADLNGKIDNLVAEVARLTGENQELTAANNTLKTEKSDLETNLTQTKSEKDELAKTLDIASTFSASNIQVTPVDEKKNGKEKVSSTAKRVNKLVVSFDVENRVALSGPADMYLIVTAPDGKVIADPTMGSSTLNTRSDGDKPFTSKVAVDYVQGQRKTVQYPIRSSDFQTGDYKVEIYHNGFKIGEGVRSLKKGGLFG